MNEGTRISLKYLCFLSISALPYVIVAQSEGKRPRIGVTLSGGGAKGLAHIGVLQAIDSAGLNVDYITGTSMGSVIGGLYAAGYSGNEIESAARPIDWGVLFSTSPPLSEISIEEKSEYEKYALIVPLEKRKIKLGRGIISGQELWLKFAQLFEPVYNVNDFSKLSIPFKCMATDLSTGDAVELSKGNIVTAIRASMAIPSVFTPIKYEGKLLADGGMVNNFPVLNVKEMGADYVIGVNLNHGLAKAEELQTSLDILGQIAFFKDAETMQKHKDACDIYIFPDITGYSAGSFAAADTIIDIGKEAGRKYYPYFKRLADSLDAKYGKQEFRKNRLPAHRTIVVSKYSVSSLKHTKEKFFFGMLGLKENREHSYKEVYEAIHRVYGSRYYSIIQYDFVPDSAGNMEMQFRVEENPLSSIKLGINYNTFTQIGVLVNLTTRDLLLRESRSFVSGSISENPQLYAEYFKYINRRRTTRIVGDYYYQATDFPVYVDFRLSQTIRSTYRVYDLQVQNNLNRYSYLAIGQQYYNSKIRTSENPSLVYNGQNKVFFSYLSYVLDRSDRKYYPTKGTEVKVQGGYVYSQDPGYDYTYDGVSVDNDSVPLNKENYFRIALTANRYQPLKPKFTLIEGADFAYIIQENTFVGDKFVVGGINKIILNQVPFAGLAVSELKTGSFGSVRLGLQYQMGKKTFIIGRANVAVYNFHGVNVRNLTAKKNVLSGYGLTFAYYSPIGPIEVTGMYCDQDAKFRSYVNLGFIF